MREKADKRIKDLLGLLDELQALHQELLDVIEKKIDAMRRADLVAIQSVAHCEEALVDRISRREGLRKQLVFAIGREMGLAQPFARNLTATELADRVTPELGSALKRKTTDLRDGMKELTRVNHVAGMITREVLRHLKVVFADVQQTGAQVMGYQADGRQATASGANVLEMVG